MAEGSSSSAVKRLLGVARRLRLTEAARVVADHLPRRMQLRVRELRARLRARSGEMDGLVEALGTVVPEAELERSYRDALALLTERLAPGQIGDYLEFGVFTGTSLACMHRALEAQGLDHVRLFGFDSFEGLPEATASDDTGGVWEAGDFGAPIGLTREVLRSKGVDLARTTLVKGWFDDTLTEEWRAENDVHTASVIMIDCDLYSSTKAALAFCAPLIRGATVILFDEWHPPAMNEAHVGERRAFEEFLAAHPSLSASELPSYRPGEAKVFLVTRNPQDPDQTRARELVQHG